MSEVADVPRGSMVGIVEGLHVMKFDYFMQDEVLARSTWPLLKGERVVSGPHTGGDCRWRPSCSCTTALPSLRRFQRGLLIAHPLRCHRADAHSHCCTHRVLHVVPLARPPARLPPRRTSAKAG